VRPGLRRRSVVPSPEPPKTSAIVRLVGIAVTVFPVPADFEGGLDAMIQPIVEPLYVNQAMGEPLYFRYFHMRVLSLPNDKHQRWKPAAEHLRIVTDLIGWHPSAEYCC
jgi:hypothetical protein